MSFPLFVRTLCLFSIFITSVLQGASLEVNFRENQGQWSDDIKYQAHFENLHINFLSDGLSLGQYRQVYDKNHPKFDDEFFFNNQEACVWNLTFKGASKKGSIDPQKVLNHHINYLKGEKRIQHVKDYKQLLYKNLYSGIDVEFLSDTRRLKYNYIVHPKADPSKIQVELTGIDSLTIQDDGQMIIHAYGMQTVLTIPEAYQVIDGTKVLVLVGFERTSHNSYAFQLEDYDSSQTLVIDPVVTVFSTFVGGNGTTDGTWGRVQDLAVDSLTGDVICAGQYHDNTFPTTPGVYQTTYGGGNIDGVVFRINSSGTQLQWATYIGGEHNEFFNALEIGPNQEIAIAGFSRSNAYPTSAGCFDNSQSPGVGEDMVFSILSPNGTMLNYSTFFGGTFTEIAYNLKYDQGRGMYYVYGRSSSTNMPTTPGCFASTNAGQWDMFLCRINPIGNGIADLDYSTYIGGSGQEGPAVYWAKMPLAINSKGNAVISANGHWSAFSTDIPTTPGCYSSVAKNEGDIYLWELDPSGNGSSDLVYGTYFGGNRGEIFWAIGLDQNDAVYGVGGTASDDMPTVPGVSYEPTKQSPPGPLSDGLIAKFSLDGNGAADLKYCTYFGGRSTDKLTDLEVTDEDDLLIIGFTQRTSIPFVEPTTCAFDKNYDGGYDNILIRFKPEGFGVSDAEMISFLKGGGLNEFEPQMALRYPNCPDEVYVGTFSRSTTNITTTGVYQPTKLNMSTSGSGTDQPVVQRYRSDIDMNFTFSGECLDIPIAFDMTLQDTCELFCDPSTFKWNFGDGTIAFGRKTSHTYSLPGVYQVDLISICPKDTVSKQLTIIDVQADAGLPVFKCGTDSVVIGAANPAPAGGSIIWSPPFDISSTTEPNPRVAPPNTRTYYLAVNQGVCVVVDSVLVTVGAQNNVDAGVDVNLCFGDTAILGGNPTAGPTATIAWSPNTNLDLSNPANPKAFPLTDTRYIVEVNENGCVASDTVWVFVSTGFANAGRDTVLCESAPVILGGNPTGLSGATFIWSPSTGLSSTTSANPLANPSQPTTYYVTATRGSCIATDSVAIDVGSVFADAGSNQTVKLGQGTFIGGNPAGPADAIFVWTPLGTIVSPSSPSTVITPAVSTMYYLTVTKGPCIAIDSVFITVLPIEGIYVPNAFSPNLDGVNDRFRPFAGSDIERINEFVVYDRWGGVLHKEVDITPNAILSGWDGRKNGKFLNPGVYLYHVEVTYVSGKTEFLKGSLTLMR